LANDEIKERQNLDARKHVYSLVVGEWHEIKEEIACMRRDDEIIECKFSTLHNFRDGKIHSFIETHTPHFIIRLFFIHHILL
jgi:hypothetical protein